MATSPTRAFREEPPALVARRSEEEFGVVEVTLFEGDLAPDDRTTRWITAAETDCVSVADWR